MVLYTNLYTISGNFKMYYITNITREIALKCTVYYYIFKLICVYILIQIKLYRYFLYLFDHNITECKVIE